MAITKNKIKTVVFEIDFYPEMMCSDEDLRDEYDNNWDKCIKCLFEEDGLGIFDGDLKFIKVKQTMTKCEIDKLGRPRIKGKIIPYAIKNGKKHCSGCNNVLDISSFHKQKTGCLSSQCKKCMSILTKKWEETHPKYHNEKAKLYRKNNPLKIIARNKTNWLQQKGLIMEKCSMCNSDKDIEKHHFDYSLADKFLFLCRICHRQLHVKLKNEQKSL